MLRGDSSHWGSPFPIPTLGGELEVPRPSKGGFLGASSRGSGGFFLEDGALLPSSGFGARRQKPKSRSAYWVGSTAPHPSPSRSSDVPR